MTILSYPLENISQMPNDIAYACPNWNHLSQAESFFRKIQLNVTLTSNMAADPVFEWGDNDLQTLVQLFSTGAVHGHEKVRTYGHERSALMATRSPRFWPPEVRTPH
jgi:hypothetical protein